MKHTFKKRLSEILGSPAFFYLVIAFFIFEAIWTALSLTYPAAFDEGYHFGLIQIYSHHLTPFFSQPANSFQYGQITHDPSYMYHYLMGFVYRLIELFTHDTNIQVIIIRMFSIAFFTGGLVLFRKVLLKLKISKALVNTVLLFFVLTPITSLLASQINYDNMLILFIPMTMLLALHFLKDLREKKQFNTGVFLGWLALCLFTSLVMYTFLPIFAAMVIYLGYVIVRKYWHSRRELREQIRSGWKRVSKWSKVGLIAAVLVTGGLFLQRDGYNTLKYGTPTPECNQVLTVAECTQYSPWDRNYIIEQNKSTYQHPTTFQFTRAWIHTMFYNLFFAINGENSNYYAQPPLPLPEWSAVFVAVFGVILAIIYMKKLFASEAAKFFGVMILVYLVTLWLQNYSDYHHLGTPVAINGRYLVPILLLVYALVGMAFREVLRRRDLAKPLLTIAVILLFLNGGGVMTYIIRSDPSWYITNQAPTKANQKAQKVLKPVVLGSNLTS